MKVLVLPKPGRTVRLPGLNNLPLPPEGAVVEFDAHWARRMQDGDIEVRELPPAAQAPAIEQSAGIEQTPPAPPRESTRRKS